MAAILAVPSSLRTSTSFLAQWHSYNHPREKVYIAKTLAIQANNNNHLQKRRKPLIKRFPNYLYETYYFR